MGSQGGKQESQIDAAESHYARSSQLEREGKYEEALAEISRSIELLPTIDHYRYTKIRLLELTGRRSQALEEYDRLLEIFPSDPGAHFSKGYFLYTKTKDYGGSRDEFGRAAELNPNKWEYPFWKGKALSLLGDYNSALKEFEKARRLVAVFSDLVRNDFALSMGVALLGMANYHQALSEFNRAVEIFQDDFTTYVYKGYTLAKMGKFEESEADFRRALDLRPRSALVYFNYAKLFVLSGRSAEGLKLLRDLQSVKLDQNICNFVSAALNGEKDRDLGAMASRSERELFELFLGDCCDLSDSRSSKKATADER